MATPTCSGNSMGWADILVSSAQCYSYTLRGPQVCPFSSFLQTGSEFRAQTCMQHFFRDDLSWREWKKQEGKEEREERPTPVYHLTKLCWSGSVAVALQLWCYDCDSVAVALWLWLCICGFVIVALWLWFCGCDPVVVVDWLWLCGFVLWQRCHCGPPTEAP